MNSQAQHYASHDGGRQVLPGTQHTLDEFWTMLARKEPELADALMPRSYQAPAGFYNPKEAAFGMANNVLGYAEYGQEARETAYDASMLLIQNDVPTYFVSPELVAAVLATSIPPDLKLSLLNFPLPAMLFIMPKGGFVLQDGSEVTYLGYATAAAGTGSEVMEGLPATAEMAQDGLLFLGSTTGDAATGSRMHLDTQTVAELADAELPLLADGTARPQPNFGKLVRQFVLKLILIISARPALRRQGSMLRPSSVKKGRRKSEMWSPNIIGQEYRARRTATETDNVGAGTGTPKRLHWVRGHLRQQPHGPRDNPTYETIWIEPFLSGRA